MVLCNSHHSCAPFQAGKLFSPAPIIQANSCLSKQSLSLSASQVSRSLCKAMSYVALSVFRSSASCVSEGLLCVLALPMPLGSKISPSQSHRVTEAEKIFSGKVFLSTGAHSQTHSLKSSSFTHVNSELSAEI